MRPSLRLASLACGVLVWWLQAPLVAQSPRFYPDDPLREVPTPLPVLDARPRALSELLELVTSTIKSNGQRHPDVGVIAARGVNTLGEVMDGEWYVNRHATRRMTTEELQRGPGNDRPPSTTQPWQVLVVKPFGLNPGLLVSDSKNDLYLLRFDPPGAMGLATGAEMVTSKFLYALGYFVTENYIVDFDRRRLVRHESGQTVSSAGRQRTLVDEDINTFLRGVPSTPGRMYRAVATRIPESREALLGPYQMWGTRSDDPNDTVPHEHRRDLRGLFVFFAWLNNSRAQAIDTQDILTVRDGIPRIRHYRVDFTGSLGSGALGGAKQAWEGHESLVPGLATIRNNIFGFGLRTESWMRARYPDLPEVGAFDATAFEPDAWTTNVPVPPFENRLPDDTFWAAKQVMAFSDEDIRALVRTGRYGQEAEEWITASLIERRNRIGQTYFARVLPLDHVRVTGQTLEFDDLGVRYGFAEPRSYTVDWRAFDNDQNVEGDVLGTGQAVPAPVASLVDGAYVVVRIHAGDPDLSVRAYLRQSAGSLELVGLDYSWPGKVVVEPPRPPSAGRAAYRDLVPRQQALFETYVQEYNTARGVQRTAEESFAGLTISEQSTFYGVSHALSHSALTDVQGASLGSAIDLVESVERIAGQYAGRGGDEQFRLYVKVKPNTRTVLEASQEFFSDHENTVYHIGYPHSFRQIGKEPNIQFSLSEDGLRADIDVDYRSSRSPQALFNGHLTAANSDVRVGDNVDRHNGRWGGLVAWWQEIFGQLSEEAGRASDVFGLSRPDAPTPIPPDRPLGATPERIEDAAQEFLTDWLVRRQYDEALAFLSPRAYTCVNIDDNVGSDPLDAVQARNELRELMEYSATQLRAGLTLTDAVAAFAPRDPNRPVVDHAFRREFLLTPLTPAEARQYVCDQPTDPAADTATYFGIVFRFRTDGGGVLGLLWTREQEQWRLISYQPLDP